MSFFSISESEKNVFGQSSSDEGKIAKLNLKPKKKRKLRKLRFFSFHDDQSFIQEWGLNNSRDNQTIKRERKENFGIFKDLRYPER
jgi:hypothetical protein